MWWEFAEKILNFAVFVAIIYYFAKKPVAGMLQKRRESIKQAMEDGERAKQEGEQLFQGYEARLKKLDQEIERIRQTLIEEGNRERDRIIKEAEQMAEKIKRQAELSAQQELKMVRLRLQEEMAAMTVQLAEELLKKHLQPKDHERLVDEYIERVRSLQ